MKFAAVALSAAVIAVSIFYLADNIYNHPRNNLLLDKADPNRVMATDIGSFSELEKIKEINGVKISIIEARAKPHAWASTGFLGQNESLIEVIKKDWTTVDKLGTTHIELANHLESIWHSFAKTSERKTISYELPLSNWNTINSESQKLEGEIIASCGVQSDIFCNTTDHVEDPIPPCWTEDSSAANLMIKNLKNNEGIQLAYGVINYIRKYGFYEGGENNPYRIDPIRLASVLTGHSYCKIASAIII